MIDVQVLAGDSQSMVDGIGATMCTDRYYKELEASRRRTGNLPFRRRIVL